MTFLQIALYSRPAHSARIYPTSHRSTRQPTAPNLARGGGGEVREVEARVSGVVEHDVGSLLRPMGSLATSQHHYRSHLMGSVSGLCSQIRSYAGQRWADRFSNFSIL